MRISLFVLLSVVFCGFFSVLLSFHGSREATPRPATFAEVAALVEAAPEAVDNQADPLKGVDPKQIGEWKSKARNLLESLDAIERIMSAVLPQHEAEYGEDLLRLLDEYESTLPPLRAAANEVLAGNTSPELRQRIQTLTDASQAKNQLAQEGIARWKNDLARKRLEAAENLGFEGITFRTTLQDVKRVLPRVSPVASNTFGDWANWKNWGLTVYRFTEMPVADELMLAFIDNDLFDISVTYGSETASKLGGFRGIEKRLIEKLGPPHHTAPSGFPGEEPRLPGEKARRVWEFKAVQRGIVLLEGKELIWGKDDEVRLSITHTARSERMEQRRAGYHAKLQGEAESRNAGF